MPNDLVDHYRLETSFDTDTVQHTRYSREHGPLPVTENWTQERELGSGAFGFVRLEKERLSKKLRAVKLIYKRGMPGGFDYRRELLAMAILTKYPNAFVDFHGWFEDSSHLFLAMEYFERGDLAAYIRSYSGDIPEDSAKTIAKQSLGALKILHREGFVHRDLKPLNIFVASTSPLWIKLGDFGVSKRIREHESTRLRTQVYTPDYAAPEVFYMDAPPAGSSAYTNAVDVWALGCVIFEVLTKGPPFPNVRKYYQYCEGISNFPRESLDSRHTSALAIKFLESMITIDVVKRITVNHALEHQWLTSNDGSATSTSNTTKSPPKKEESSDGPPTKKEAREKLPVDPITQIRDKFEKTKVNGDSPTTIEKEEAVKSPEWYIERLNSPQLLEAPWLSALERHLSQRDGRNEIWMAKFVFLEGHFALLSSIPGARDTGHRSHPILWRDRNYRASLVTCVEAVVSCQYPDVSRILRKYGLQTVTQYNIYRKSITASDQINLIGLAQCLHDTSTIVGATAARSLTHICNLWGSPVVLEACKTVGYRTWVSRLTSAINSGFSHTSTDHARIYVAESLRLCNHMLVVTTGTNELEIEVRGALEKEGLSRILTLLQEEQDLDIQEQLRDYRIAKASQFTRGTTIRGNFGEEV